MSARDPREQSIPSFTIPSFSFSMPCEFCEHVSKGALKAFDHFEEHFRDGPQLRLWPE